MLHSQKIDLGLESSYIQFPARISIENQSYYIVRHENSYQLFSSVCPHAGGNVQDIGNVFECPNHGWQFDRLSGKCINAPSEYLSSIPIYIEYDRLWVNVPMRAAGLIPPSVHKHKAGITIQLHSHSSLEFRYENYTLLTDPWFFGPAFMGGWIQYPPPITNFANLHYDGIYISHEHPDHFHEPTLNRVNRTVPIYIPDFPNQRMVERLEALGFKNIVPLSFGETREISDNFKLTAFEPGSLFNDSIVLMEMGDLRFLNLNDAGLNPRIAAYVAPVDVVASAYSPVASGYPVTWSHLSDTQKIAIMERGCRGMLDMLSQAMKLYKASYLLPFAGDFALWHPSHQNYMRLLRTNTLNDVVKAFADTPIRVIDLLPGETWNAQTDQIQRTDFDRRKLNDREAVIRHLKETFNKEEFDKHHPVLSGIQRTDVENYFLRMNDLQEMVYCESILVRIGLLEGSFDRGGNDLFFEVKNGCVKILPVAVDHPNLEIEIPCGLLDRIIRQNLSWDEAQTGYWCRFKRSPDIYHAGFWRLLHAPYFKRAAEPPKIGRTSITGDTVIADLIEQCGDDADRILRRYGLYCSGCQHSPAESIALGARLHGVEQNRIDRLVQELNRTLRTRVPSIVTTTRGSYDIKKS